MTSALHARLGPETASHLDRLNDYVPGTRILLAIHPPWAGKRLEYVLEEATLLHSAGYTPTIFSFNRSFPEFLQNQHTILDITPHPVYPIDSETPSWRWFRKPPIALEDAVYGAITQGTIPFVFPQGYDSKGIQYTLHPATAFATLARTLNPASIVVVTTAGEIVGPHGEPLPVFSMEDDYPRMRANGYLPSSSLSVVRLAEDLLDHIDHSTHLSITGIGKIALTLCGGAGTRMVRSEDPSMYGRSSQKRR